LLYHLRLQPSEVEQMPYYEYEYIVENLINILKEKQEAEENQSKDYGESLSANKMMNNANSMMPKMPSMPSTPSFSMPSGF
jgi:hypothetical protein